MKTQNLLLILGGIAIVAVLIVVYQKKKTNSAKVSSTGTEEETLCFKLPTDSDPKVFGREYWRAYQKITSSIPCSGCKGFAEKFISFFQDLVNLKLGKPLFDPENFAEMAQLITTIHLKGDKWPE